MLEVDEERQSGPEYECITQVTQPTHAAWKPSANDQTSHEKSNAGPGESLQQLLRDRSYIRDR